MKINEDLQLSGSSNKLSQITTNKTNITKLFNHQFQSSNSDTISIKPTYNCYVIVIAETDTWGYDGGTVTISVTNTAGSATLVKSMTGRTKGHNTTGVPVTAIACYQCNAGTSYTFGVGRSNNGGRNSTDMFLFTMAR